MCGIAGLVYDSSQGADFPWDNFDSELKDVLSYEPEKIAGNQLADKLESLFNKAQRLKEFSSIQLISTSAEALQRVQAWARELTGWEARVSDYLDHTATLDSSQQEQLNGVLVICRDLL